jgi:hypothetical protein
VFIELTDATNEQPILINIDHVDAVEPYKGEAVFPLPRPKHASTSRARAILTTSGTQPNEAWYVTETYDLIRRMIQQHTLILTIADFQPESEPTNAG